MATITHESKLTLSLAASGGTDLIQLEGECSVGLDLESDGSPSTCDGTLQFRRTNDPSLTPKPMTTELEVTAGTAVSNYTELKTLPGGYLQLYWDRDSGGTGETLTARISITRS